jgi:DNA-directed RNA polymerase specialized sigma subunit
MRLLLTPGIVVTAVYFKRDLGLTATEVGKHLGLSKSAVSRAATRGQKLIVDQFLSLKN